MSSIGLRPVFLVAPMNRSGTKFLKSVLLTHPSVTQGFALEDYSLAYTDQLLDYARSMSRHWCRTEDERAGHHERLLDAFGPFLVGFFADGASKEATYLLLTTPRPWGLSNVFRLFPEGRVIVIVRDGSDTVESARRSFRGGDLSYWTEEWQRGAAEVLKFAEVHHDALGTRWDIVSFEDSVRDVEAVGRRLCDFLHLDSTAIDWDGVKQGPIRGSSEHGGPSHSAPRTDSFNPVGRASGWSWMERRKFQRIAGASDEALKRIVVDRSNSFRQKLAPTFS